MSKRILVVGDLHTKFDILQRVEELAPSYDQVIFLGDYVDDWGKVPEASYNLLQELIEFKKRSPNVILLLGNHDLSEWFGGVHMCSGFSFRTSSLVKDLFQNNEDCFEIAYAEENILFTHAGLMAQFADLIGIEPQPTEDMGTNAERYAKFLNTTLHQRETNDKAKTHFHSSLPITGMGRGGVSDFASPLWADRRELISSPCPYLNQVVGHSPVESICEYEFSNPNNTTNFIYFCDTFSTRPNGEPIGDKSLLTLEIDNENITADIIYI